MRPYQHQRSHHRNPYMHRIFATEVAHICREFRDGQYLQIPNNYFNNLKELKKVIREHLNEIGLHTSARERNQLLRQAQHQRTDFQVLEHNFWRRINIKLGLKGVWGKTFS